MAGFDDFDTIGLLEAYEQMPKPEAFLRDTFFGNTRTFETESVQVDLYVGKRRMAPFLARYQGGRALLVEGFRTQLHTPPKFAPSRVLPAEDLLYRGLGETPYGGRSPTQRAADILSRDMFECDASITRREEWMCSNCLLTGSVAMKGDGGGEFAIVYDSDPRNPNTPISWEESATCDPLMDLAQMQAQVRRAAGVNADVAILAADAAAAFMRSQKVRDFLNIRNLYIGTVQPSIESDQVTFICRLAWPDIEIYSYDEFYLDFDAEGHEIDAPFMPPGTVLVGSTESPGFMIYGGIIQYEPGQTTPSVYAAERVPLLFTDVDNQVRKFRFTSRPLPVPMNVKGHFGANALGKGNAEATFPNFTDLWAPPPTTPGPSNGGGEPTSAPKASNKKGE